MRFYTKNMGIMLEFFFSILNSRVGEGESGDKVPSDPSGHALVLTQYYNNIYLTPERPGIEILIKKHFW